MLEKLRYLIALAQARHFTHAAELCGITQASMSTGIRSLEDMLGTVLVNRTGGFRGFTAEGERVLMWAYRIVGQVTAMEKDISCVAGERDTHLRIGAVSSAIPMLTKLTVSFLTRYPNTLLTVLVRPTTGLVDMLQSGEIDVGVTYITGEFKGISIPLGMPKFVLATTPAGPLGGAKNVTWAQVSEIPLCLLGRQTEDRELIEEIFRKLRARTQSISEATSFEHLMSRVQLGHLSAIIPATSAPPARAVKSIRTIPIIGPNGLHPVWAIAREGISASSSAAAFIDQLQPIIGTAKNGCDRQVTKVRTAHD